MLIEAKGLKKTYKNDKGVRIEALRNANVAVRENECVGLFGSSGSGKSTIGQIMVGLLPPDEGSISYRGKSVKIPYGRGIRREIQMLYQHPEVSFNPKLTLLRSLIEPYQLMGIEPSRERILKDNYRFGIYAEHLERYPGELSGGELQRAALARILVLKPRFIVLDEPTSMLDAISQAQVVQILREIQKETGVGYLFITHNKALCQAFSSRFYRIREGITEEVAFL